MPAAKKPKSEHKRLNALLELDVLDTPEEAVFDDIVKQAAETCDKPIALISLVDQDRQWFKARVGLDDATETHRDAAFCAHAILDDDILHVEDATQDPRFSDNPLVLNDPSIRFYAGMPLKLHNGHNIGTLCVIDSKPGHLSDAQKATLAELSKVTVKALEARHQRQFHVDKKRLASNALAVVEHSLDPIISLDLSGHIIQWNPAAARLFGYTQNKAVNEHISMIIPDDRADEEQNIQKLLQSQKLGYEYNTVRCHKNGRRIDVNINILPIFDDQNTLIGATKIVKDRTHNLRVLHEISSNEAKFRALTESSPLGIFSTDIDGACTYTNQRWQDIFGLSAENSLGHRWTDVIHQQDRQHVIQTWQRCADERIDFDMEFRIIPHKNKLTYVHAHARAVLDEAGEINSYIGNVADITERFEHQRSILEQQKQIQQIIHNQSVATFMIDAEHRVLHWNKACEVLTGVAAKDIVGTQDAWRGFYPEARPCLADLVVDHHKDRAGQFYPIQGESKLTESGWHAENWFDKLGGKKRYVIFDAAPIYDTEGNIVAAIETLQDVTDQQKAAQRLEANEKLLNRTGEVAGVGGWEYDLIENKITWTDETCKIHKVPTGYQPTIDEAIKFYPPIARDTITAAIDEAIASGKPWDLELPFIQKDGTQIWVRAVGTVEKSDGKPVKLYGALQNIDEVVQQRQAIEESNIRVNLATNSGQIGVWDWDIVTNEVVWDDAMYKLYGIQPQSKPVNYTSWLDFVHPDDGKHLQKLLEKAVTHPRELDTEFRIIWSDKSIHYIRLTAQLKTNAKNKVMNMVGACWDVTEIREMANQLVEQNEYMHVTMQSIADAVITTDAFGDVTWLNPIAERLTGWLKSEAIGKPIEQIFVIHNSTENNALHPVLLCLQNNGDKHHSENTTLISKDSIEYGIEDSIAPIRNSHHQILGSVVVFRDVTEKRKITEEIQYKASHDLLTGLVNRSEFESRITRILDEAHQNATINALMFIDLDQFKLVNDACGHAAGDQLLKEVSSIFSHNIRQRDTLARLGGDEFAIVLEKCPIEQAEKIAQKICDQVNEFRFIYDNKRYRVGTSIGLVPLDSRWTNISQAIQTADACCYAAKEQGRNRVHRWLESDNIIKQRQGDMLWAARIEQAMEQNQFMLYAQRIQSTDKRKSKKLHIEILLRLKDEYGNIITPNVFIPAAERYHLISRLDMWVVEKTIQWITENQAKTSLGMVHINISGDSISDRAFHEALENLLAKTKASIRRLICLEITETAAISGLSNASVFIHNLHALDVKVALDDFGAGASSFGYLRSMKVDMLKIDGQFVKNICTDALNDSAVRCFVDIAKILGITTIAEFVENQESLDHIKNLGVDYGQGYLIHKPCPINEVINPKKVPA